MYSLLRRLLLILLSTSAVFWGSVLLQKTTIAFSHSLLGGFSFLGMYGLFLIIHFALLYSFLSKEIIQNFHQQILFLAKSRTESVVLDKKDIQWNFVLIGLIIVVCSILSWVSYDRQQASLTFIIAFLILLTFLIPIAENILYYRNLKSNLIQDLEVQSTYYRSRSTKVIFLSFLFMISFFHFSWKQLASIDLTNSTYSLTPFSSASGCLATHLWKRNELECFDQINFRFTSLFPGLDTYFYLYGECEFTEKSISSASKKWVITKCLKEECSILFFSHLGSSEVNFKLSLPPSTNKCNFRIKSKVAY